MQIMHLVRSLAHRKLTLAAQLVEETAMTEFQKIATGILGFTHPEMFIPRPGPGQKPAARFTSDHDSIEPVRRGEGAYRRTLRALRFMLAALAIGSRTVALADNSQLRRDLNARARLLYGSDEG
jgi:hypothetical protein